MSHTPAPSDAPRAGSSERLETWLDSAGWLATVAVLLLALWGLPGARAQTVAALALPPPAATSDSADGGLQARAQAWLDQQMAQREQQANEAGALPLRPEVVVGQLDQRLRLAPCDRVEPYLPPGTRLWGQTRIGLRCAQGPVAWNVFLPVTVKAFGPAWVLRRPVARGAVLTQADAELAEIDWAASVSPVLGRPQDWVGAEAMQALLPGQVLRQSMVRSAAAFAAGSPVNVVVVGGGFRLSAGGEAVTAGVLGQAAKVRMPNGRIVSGTVRQGPVVEVSL